MKFSDDTITKVDPRNFREVDGKFLLIKDLDECKKDRILQQGFAADAQDNALLAFGYIENCGRLVFWIFGTAYLDEAFEVTYTLECHQRKLPGLPVQVCRIDFLLELSEIHGDVYVYDCIPDDIRQVAEQIRKREACNKSVQELRDVKELDQLRVPGFVDDYFVEYHKMGGHDDFDEPRYEENIRCRVLNAYPERHVVDMKLLDEPQDVLGKHKDDIVIGVFKREGEDTIKAEATNFYASDAKLASNEKGEYIIANAAEVKNCAREKDEQNYRMRELMEREEREKRDRECKVIARLMEKPIQLVEGDLLISAGIRDKWDDIVRTVVNHTNLSMAQEMSFYEYAKGVAYILCEYFNSKDSYVEKTEEAYEKCIHDICGYDCKVQVMSQKDAVHDYDCKIYEELEKLSNDSDWEKAKEFVKAFAERHFQNQIMKPESTPEEVLNAFERLSQGLVRGSDIFMVLFAEKCNYDRHGWLFFSADSVYLLTELIDKKSMEEEFVFELYSYPYDKLKFFLLDRPRYGLMVWHTALEYDTSRAEDLEDDYPCRRDEGYMIGWILEGTDNAKEGNGSALAQLLYKLKKLKKA